MLLNRPIAYTVAPFAARLVTASLEFGLYTVADPVVAPATRCAYSGVMVVEPVRFRLAPPGACLTKSTPRRQQFEARPPMTGRTLSRKFSLAALVALACHVPNPAHAEPPAPRELLRLDDRLMRTSRVRVTLLSETVVAEGARADTQGLAYRSIREPLGAGLPPGPDRIPWDSVLRIDKPSNHALPAALVTGVVLGVIAGAATYAASEAGKEGGPGVMFVVPLATIVAAGVGALIPAWHPIYRKRRS